MRVGIVGSGRLGAPLGRLLAVAGHDVLFSDARPARAKEAAGAAAGHAGGGSPVEAVRDMPYWGDDDEAKKAVVPLIEDAGFTAIDGGGLSEAL
jgi:predicted dinucleotide-binding enzyme